MQTTMLTPVLALIVWTFVIWFWLYATRLPAMRAAGIDPARIKRKGDLDPLPVSVQQIADNYNHLHEQPTRVLRTGRVHAPGRGRGPAERRPGLGLRGPAHRAFADPVHLELRAGALHGVRAGFAGADGHHRAQRARVVLNCASAFEGAAMAVYADDEKDDKPERNEQQRPESIIDQLSFKSRFVFLFGDINHTVARTTCERLVAMAQQSDAPIRVLISSPGGHVESGDAIHDVIRFIGAPVTTIGTGWVASAGTHIFLAAEKERRVCLPNTRFMIHQPAGGAGGPATDIAIQAKEILRTRERIARTIAKQTGKSLREGDRATWSATSG